MVSAMKSLLIFSAKDTILENIARMYGVKVSEILLDRESEDRALRHALGKIIMETKKALAEAGVNVTSLENFADDKKRSKHILLVKNLPFAATEKELAQMFGKFGSIDKIILPPTKALALVVFLERAEARAAMSRLVYKRYIDRPLHLEWAPGDILDLDHKVEMDSDITEIIKRGRIVDLENLTL